MQPLAARHAVATCLSALRQPVRPFSRSASGWTGRQPSDHVTNQDHKLNVHAAASNEGQEQRAHDQADTTTHKHSAATSQSDAGGLAKEVEQKTGRKDRAMGLQDERGGVSAA